MLIETNLLLKVLILDVLDKCVRYKATILGSVGNDFKPCLVQKILKSLKSDLYALKVLLAFEFLNYLMYLHVAIF